MVRNTHLGRTGFLCLCALGLAASGRLSAVEDCACQISQKTADIARYQKEITSHNQEISRHQLSYQNYLAQGNICQSKIAAEIQQINQLVLQQTRQQSPHARALLQNQINHQQGTLHNLNWQLQHCQHMMLQEASDFAVLKNQLGSLETKLNADQKELVVLQAQQVQYLAEQARLAAQKKSTCPCPTKECPESVTPRPTTPQPSPQTGKK